MPSSRAPDYCCGCKDLLLTALFLRSEADCRARAPRRRRLLVRDEEEEEGEEEEDVRMDDGEEE